MNYRMIALAMTVLTFRCTSSEPLQGVDLVRVIETLKDQTGGTRGYPDWSSTIFENEPAKTILKAAGHNLSEVVSELKKRVSDKTPTTHCTHEGRGGSRMKYTVGDIACFILAQIHDEETIEIVITELQRRHKTDEEWSPIAWAIRYFDRALDFRKM